MRATEKRMEWEMYERNVSKIGKKGKRKKEEEEEAWVREKRDQTWN